MLLFWETSIHQTVLDPLYQMDDGRRKNSQKDILVRHKVTICRLNSFCWGIFSKDSIESRFRWLFYVFVYILSNERSNNKAIKTINQSHTAGPNIEIIWIGNNIKFHWNICIWLIFSTFSDCSVYVMLPLIKCMCKGLLNS